MTAHHVNKSVRSDAADLPVLAAAPGGVLSRRSLILASLATPALAAFLASCGSDRSASEAPPTTGADVTTPPQPAYEYPTGAEDVVVRVGYEGGFVPMSTAWINLPSLLVSGAGRAIKPGAVTLIYPGPLLSPLTERSISPEGIEKLLAAADAAGLLQEPPSYEVEMTIADAADTVVVLNAKGGTFVHRAYALGMEEKESTEARQTLLDFVRSMDDLVAAAGPSNVGVESELVPDAYRILATPVTEADLEGFEIDPTQTPWPSGTGVALADADSCVVVSADSAGAALTEATQLTYFTENDLIYQVAAVAVLPGDDC